MVRVKSAFVKVSKKALSITLSIIMAMSVLPIAAKAAESSSESYQYVIFTGGTGDSLDFCNSSLTINGDIHSNGKMTLNGGANINGDCGAAEGVEKGSKNLNIKNEIDNASVDKIILINNKIKSTYFSDKPVKDSYYMSDVNVNLNQSFFSGKDIHLSGNISLNCSIGSENNIILDGNTLNSNNTVIYSEYGNITINNDNATVNGLIYAPNGKVTVKGQNFQVNGAIIAKGLKIDSRNVNINENSSVAKFIGNTSEIHDRNLALYAYGEYDKDTGSVNVMWSGTDETGTFDIMTSENGSNYTKCNSVADTNEYAYQLDGMPKKIYFKVIQTTSGGKTVESNSFSMKKTDNGYELKFDDTDGEGLADVYEKILGTDPKKPDTDGDGLSDYEEVYITGTAPTIADTDGNGVSDADEDTDADGLTNIKEVGLGTQPLTADTDSDVLSDGEEVNTYGTDPLKVDTDGDGILDGDEILLGLNPNDSSDGEPPVNQTISKDEMSVNKYNDNFKISINVDASNNVKQFIKQGVSRYSGILSDNKSIVGVPVNIEYNAGTIVSGTIKFNLDNDFVNNNPHYYPEMGLGIDRYGVFYYDDDVGTIVPVPCDYDEENNSIIIEAKYMGNLMIVDYESLMFDLGIEPETDTYDVPMATSFACNKSESVNETSVSDIEIDDSANEVTDFKDVSLERIKNIINDDDFTESKNLTASSLFPDGAAVKSSSIMRQVDLVLVVDTTGSMGSKIAAVKTNLSKLISNLRKDGISLYVSVVDYRDITCDGVNSTKVNNNSGMDFYNSVSDISSAISSLYPGGGGDYAETAIDGLGATYYLDYRNSSAKFAFLITDATYKNNNNYKISNMTEMAEKLKSKGISTSVVTYPSIYNTYEGLTTFTGGELISMYGDFCDDMYEAIYSRTPKSSVVIANNIVTGFFKEKLVYGGSCDTDGDTLSDSSEVDWDNVKKVYDDGSYSLYTWKELCEKSWIWSSDYDDGKKNLLFDAMSDILVIPAFSNPFSADTDKDYYPDNIDEDKLNTNPMYIYDAGIDDSDFHKGTSVTAKESDKYTDGKLTVNNNAGTAKYSFARRSNNFAYFTLTPDATSFYKLANKANLAASITVTYEKGWGLWKKTVSVKPEKDGTYLLDQGKEYTIEVYGRSSSEFDFTVKQDNWVYAPNGGKWKVTKYSNSSAYLRTLCCEKIYMPSYRIVSSILKLTDDAVCVQIDPTGDVEAQLEAILRNTGMKVTEDELQGAIKNIAGAAATTTGTIVAILVPDPASTAWGLKKVGKFVIGLVGDSLTYSGVPSAIQTLYDYMEQCGFERAFTEGNANVMASKYISIGLGNVWDPWNSAPYINKISIMNDIGTVDTNVSDQQIIDWCGWKLED